MEYHRSNNPLFILEYFFIPQSPEAFLLFLLREQVYRLLFLQVNEWFILRKVLCKIDLISHFGLAVVSRHRGHGGVLLLHILINIFSVDTTDLFNEHSLSRNLASAWDYPVYLLQFYLFHR